MTVSSHSPSTLLSFRGSYLVPRTPSGPLYTTHKSRLKPLSARHKNTRGRERSFDRPVGISRMVNTGPMSFSFGLSLFS